MEPEKQILKIDKASKLTGLAVPTLYGYISARKIPFLKIGRAVRFDREELKKWIDTHRVPAIGGTSRA